MAVTQEDRSFWSVVREDHLANGKDWTRPGFRALFMYRFGVWRMGIRIAPLRIVCSFVYRTMHRYVRNHYGIELNYTATVGRRVQIAHQGAIVIHEHAVIGDDCVLRQGVTLGAAAEYDAEKAPKLGNGVDVGAGAAIIGAVTVGDNVRIGPNAVVMSNIPAGSTAFTAPARVIKMPAAQPSAAA